MHKVEDLIIWGKAMALTKEVYELIADLSQNEKYGLSIANGPTYELQTKLMLVVELKMIEETKV